MDRLKIASELVKIANSIVAAPSESLDRKTIKTVNEVLHEISTHDSKTYYKKIPLDSVFGALKKHGIIAVQEDGTPWSGFLVGREGHTNIEVARDLGDKKVGPVFKNTLLHMNWTKMEPSGNYEFLVRLT